MTFDHLYIQIKILQNFISHFRNVIETMDFIVEMIEITFVFFETIIIIKLEEAILTISTTAYIYLNKYSINIKVLYIN